jgi:uncharacterized protein YjbJ (UPF0337 family)
MCHETYGHGIRLDGDVSKPTESVMNDNQVRGWAKEIKGALKEGLGKVTGNTAREVGGKIEKVVGKAQKSLGDAQARNRKASRWP